MPTLGIPSGSNVSWFWDNTNQRWTSGSGGTGGSGGGGDPGASYLVLGLTASLPNARMLYIGNGIRVSDSGPNNLYNMSISDNEVATVSGTTFTGDVRLNSTIVGYGENIFSASAKGTDVFFYVSGTIGLTGSIAKKTMFGGDVVMSGTLYAAGVNRITPIDSYTMLQWKLNEPAAPFYSSGSTALTMSVGAGSPVPGMIGLFDQSVYLDGGTPYLTSGNTTIEPSGSATTVSVWFNPTVFSAYQVIAQKSYRNNGTWLAPFTTIYLILNNSADGGLYVGITVGGQLKTTTTTTPYRALLNHWNLLVMTYDGTNARFYLNGNLAATINAAGGLDFGTHGPWEIGGVAEAAGQEFAGFIEDVRVENVVRSQSYIRAMYKKGLGMF